MIEKTRGTKKVPKGTRFQKEPGSFWNLRGEISEKESTFWQIAGVGPHHTTEAAPAPGQNIHKNIIAFKMKDHSDIDERPW